MLSLLETEIDYFFCLLDLLPRHVLDLNTRIMRMNPIVGSTIVALCSRQPSLVLQAGGRSSCGGVRRFLASSSSSPSSPNRLLELDSLRNRYCALRHGQSLANVAKLISSHPQHATVQHGLSQTGILQAKAAGKDVIEYYFQQAESLLLQGIAVLSSDYLRAKETAQHVVDAIVLHNDNNDDSKKIPLYGGGVVLEERLRERWFGDWDGGSDVHYPDVWRDDVMDPSHTHQNVESVNAVTDRTTACIVEWDQQRGLDNHLVVLVAHGDVLQITQTAFSKHVDGSQHRSLPHLETATLRPLHLERKEPENV